MRLLCPHPCRPTDRSGRDGGSGRPAADLARVGVFSERDRAALELAEAFTYIHEGGIPDDVYDRVGGILSEKEYTAISWLSVSINAFNRVAIAGRYPVPPLEPTTGSDTGTA